MEVGSNPLDFAIILDGGKVDWILDGDLIGLGSLSESALLALQIVSNVC